MTEHEYCVVHDLASVRAIRMAVSSLKGSSTIKSSQLTEMFMMLHLWTDELERELNCLMDGEA